jgi:hypothetical protein
LPPPPLPLPLLLYCRCLPPFILFCRLRFTRMPPSRLIDAVYGAAEPFCRCCALFCDDLRCQPRVMPPRCRAAPPRLAARRRQFAASAVIFLRAGGYCSCRPLMIFVCFRPPEPLT